MGYPTDAIYACYEVVHDAIPSAQYAGSYGNKPGYHNCRANLPSSDYSVQRADDQKGDAQAGSALDITFPNPPDIKRCTQNLIDATLADDPRVWCLREFFGTVNGNTVTGLDVRDKRWVTSDDSHLWHNHLSFYRKYANDMAAAKDVGRVMIGQIGEDDMTKEETENMIANALRAYHLGGEHGVWSPDKYGKFIKDEDNGVGDRLTRLEKQAD